MAVPRRSAPTVVCVIEPDGFQTRVATVNGEVVHQCRVDARILGGQLEFAIR
jgi:hypothetical protein